MVNNFYRSIDVVFDRFEVKWKSNFVFLINFILLDIISLYVFFYLGVCKE